LATKGERVLPIWPPGSDGAIGAGHRRAVGGGDPHAGERRRSRVVHRFQHAEPIEDAERLRAQVLATDLGPRKPRPIEDEDAKAALGEQDRGGRAGGAGADDDDVGAHAPPAMTRAGPPPSPAEPPPAPGCPPPTGFAPPASRGSCRSSGGKYDRRTDSGPSSHAKR